MKICSDTITIHTVKAMELCDITAEIRRFVRESAIATGQLTVFVPHTTAAVTVNENTDLDVSQDILYSLKKNLPDEAAFKHLEGNAHAHVKASVIGVSVTLLIEKRTLVLGTWQGIFLCEFDGPRQRRIQMQAMGVE